MRRCGSISRNGQFCSFLSRCQFCAFLSRCSRLSRGNRGFVTPMSWSSTSIVSNHANKSNVLAVCQSLTRNCWILKIQAYFGKNLPRKTGIPISWTILESFSAANLPPGNKAWLPITITGFFAAVKNSHILESNNGFGATSGTLKWIHVGQLTINEWDIWTYGAVILSKTM